MLTRASRTVVALLVALTLILAIAPAASATDANGIVAGTVLMDVAVTRAPNGIPVCLAVGTKVAAPGDGFLHSQMIAWLHVCYTAITVMADWFLTELNVEYGDWWGWHRLDACGTYGLAENHSGWVMRGTSPCSFAPPNSGIPIHIYAKVIVGWNSSSSGIYKTIDAYGNI